MKRFSLDRRGDRMRITVIGAGNLGLAMCAYLGHEGHDVLLWNRSYETIKHLQKTRYIDYQGVISGRAQLVCATTDLSEAIQDTELILITTPAFAHKELAHQLAACLTHDVPVVLNPGRTFGAIEFSSEFKTLQSWCPLVAETQSTVYTCRKVSDDRVDILSLKDDVLIACTDMSKIEWLLSYLPKCISNQLQATKSLVQTSIGNVGMMLHCAPLLLNSGWTENDHTSYKYYHEGITPTISHFLEKLDFERVAVSYALGCPVESTKSWLRHTYHVEGDTLYECIQNTDAYHHIYAPESLRHRYIYEDVPYGLVPLEALGLKLGLLMKHTTLLIDLACTLLDVDFRLHGRNLESLSVTNQNEILDEIIESEATYDSI
jgi:opine dehydrogenase